MSNQYQSKTQAKPLKGGGIAPIYANFNVLSAENFIFQENDITELLDTSLLDGINIINSGINNTVIGEEVANEGYFTELKTFDDVTFLGKAVGNDVGNDVYWDSNNSTLNLLNDTELNVEGCSQFGNIRICVNDIKATNDNGNINIIPDGIGSIVLRGPVFNRSTSGNFYTEMVNGKIDLLSDRNIQLYSSHGSFSLNTLDDQSSITKNGNIELRVEDGLTAKNISVVNFTTGNINISTSNKHYLTTGNLITISNNSLLNGIYTVGNIISDTSFYLTTTTELVDSASGGTLLKSASNNIVLNSQNLVTIPNNTKLTLGTTTNNITGNTTGLYINSNSSGNIFFSTSSLVIPQNTNIQLGTSASNYINFNGNSININGAKTTINSTNTTFYDPILTLADYTQLSSDGKDRGIEFRYYASGSNKLGWFGYKSSTGKFTYYSDATNTNEIITGTLGDFDFNSLAVSTVTLTPSGTIDVNCGNLLNVNNIYGCSNNLNITATNRIYLNSSNEILIPNNTNLKFSTNGSLIKENTNGNLVITSNLDTLFITRSNGSLIIPVNTKLIFDGTTNSNLTINGNTSGELLLKSNSNIYLTTTGGNIIIPQSTNIQLGTTSQSIYGSTSGITTLSNFGSGSLFFISNSSVNISSSTGNIHLSTDIGDINLIPTNGNVRIVKGSNLVFNLNTTANSIGLRTNNNLIISGDVTNSLEISNYSNVNIPTNTKLNINNNLLSYITSNTSNDLSINNLNSNGSITITGLTTSITNTSGTLNVLNTNTYISSSNYIITGGIGSVTRIDSSNVRMKDPILSLSDYTILSPDGKDKGLEYNFFRSSDTSFRHGWFGYKDSTSRFTYYVDAVNTNEVITGTLGDIEANSGYFKNLNITNVGSNLDFNCGNILNVNSIYGCSTDISINSNNIKLNANEKILLPYNIPLSFGNTVNNISCTPSGDLQITSLNKIILNSDVQINGTTFNVYSTVTNIKDPIFSLGGVTGPLIDDDKDRGIEFKWYSSSITKTGFFGFKDTPERFVFIKDGTNTNEVFSGDYGDVQFGDAYLNNINLDNGNITGVAELSGGTINIMTTSGDLLLSPTKGTSIVLPYFTQLAFGNTQNSILSNTYNNLLISSRNSISFNTTTNIRFPDNVPIYLGPSTGNYILSTSSNLELHNSYGNIYLTPAFSSGSVLIPEYNYLNFGSTSTSIYSDGDKLYINGYQGINFNSSTVNFSGDINIVGTLTATSNSFDLNDYILPLGTSQVLDIINIQNSPTTDKYIKVTVDTIHYLNIGDIVILSNTNSQPPINGTFTVKTIQSEFIFEIENTTRITVDGDFGILKSNLKEYQGKDVGIQVNYWSSTGNIGLTAGSLGYKTGFFGFDISNERWSFYTEATIQNSIVSGETGDIDVNKVYTKKMSGYTLEGTLSGGNSMISGNNFDIDGGYIDGTPIGEFSRQSGKFTTLNNNNTASLTGVTLQTTLAYNLTDNYVLSNIDGFQYRNPSPDYVVSMFSVTGAGYTNSSGTMPSVGIVNGSYKIIVCKSMAHNCEHTIFFGENKLIVPNPISSMSNPTKLVFKRQSQSAQLLFIERTEQEGGNAWLLLNSGAYVE